MYISSKGLRPKIESELAEELRASALRSGVTVTRLVQEALRQYLTRYRGRGKTLQLRQEFEVVVRRVIFDIVRFEGTMALIDAKVSALVARDFPTADALDAVTCHNLEVLKIMKKLRQDFFQLCESFRNRMQSHSQLG